MKQYSDTSDGNCRGAVIKLFGVILIILGTLDTMLSWRGGLDLAPFHGALIATGLLLCLVGAVRHQGRR